MATVTEVNRIINEILVEDNTADGAASAIENIDRVTEATDRGAESATDLSNALKTGMETAKDAATSGATAVVDSTGRMVNAWRDGSSSVAEDAAKIDRAVTGVSEAVDALQDGMRLDGDSLGTESVGKDLDTVQADMTNLSDTAKSTSSDMRESVTTVSESVQKAAEAGSLAWDQMSQSVVRAFARSGDAVSKQINRTLTEYGKLKNLEDMALSAVADGDMSQSDADRVISNQTAKVDASAASVGVARVNAAVTPEQIAKIAAEEQSEAVITVKVSAAFEAQQAALQEVKTQFDAGIVSAKGLSEAEAAIVGQFTAVEQAATAASLKQQGSIVALEHAAETGTVVWTDMSESVVKAFSKSGDAVSELIGKTVAEYKKLQDIQSTAASAVTYGDMSQSDAARVVGNQTARVDASAASVGVARVSAVTSPDEITAMAQQEGSEAAIQQKLTAAAQAQTDALKELSTQYKAGIVSAQGFAEGQMAITGQYDALVQAENLARHAQDNNSTAAENSTRLVKLQGYQIGILTDEVHKFVDMVIAGGSPLQALIYEGPNAVQAMGGVGSAISRVSSFMAGPGGLAVGAAAAGLALYKMGSYAEQQAEQLAQLGQRLRATRADYIAMSATAEQAAQDLSQHSDLSLSDSRTVTQTIISVPTVDRTQIDRLTTDARDLSTVLGVTVPDAAKTMATALRDPAAAAKQFADQDLQGFDAGLVLTVEHMQQMGDRAGALSTVLTTLESSFVHAHEAGLTPFQQALEDLKDKTGQVGDAVVYSATHIGDGIVGMATSSIHAFADLIDAAKKLPDELSSVASAVESTAGSVVGWIGAEVEKGVEALTPATLAHSMQQGSTADPIFAQPNNPATGGTSPTVTRQNNAQSAQSAQAMIDQVAKEQNLDSDLTYLMHQIQPEESSTGQYKNGTLATSSKGAIGSMQVMPANAAGYDLTDLHGNVSAAAKLIKSYYDKYSGNQTLTAMAYNWGPTAVDNWRNSGAHQESVPAATQKYIQDTTKGAVYGPHATAVMDQQVNDVVGKGDTGTSAELESYNRDLISEQAAIDALNKKKQTAGGVDQSWSQEMKVAQDRLDATRAAIANTRDPLQQMAHDQDQLAESSAALTGYQRQMVTVAQQADQAQLKSNGLHASASTVLAAQARAEKILGNEWQAGTAAVTQQVAAQDRVNAAYQASGGSIEHATHYAQAYQEAQGSFSEGSPQFVAAVATRTAALDKLSTAQHDLQLMQQTTANDDQLTILQTETATIGQNADARTKLITRMQAEQQLTQQGISLTDQSAQAYLASVDAVSDATAAYQHQEQTLTDLTGSLEGMTEQLTDGITQGFLQGTSSGMSFKTTLQGIETQVVSMVAKFALINPLLNSIDGKSRDTLSDITGLFSGSVSKDSGAGSDLSSLESVFSSSKGIDGSAMSAGQALNYKNALSSPTAATSSIEGLESFGGGTYGSGINGSSGGLLSGVIGTKLLGSSTVGSALGGLGGGMALGSLAGQIGGGTGGTLGSGIGAGVGALAGSFIPGVGTLIGGLAGGALGGLFGGLFSKSHYAYSDLVASNGAFGIGGTRTKHADNDVTAGMQSDIDTVNTVLSQSGVSVGDGSFGAVGHYHKGKTTSSTTLEDLLPDAKLSSSDANMNLALQQLMPTSFDSVSSYTQDIQSLKSLSNTMDAMGASVSKFDDSSHVTVDHFTGYTGDMATALSTLDGKDLSTTDLESKFDAIKTFVGSTMPGLLDVTAAGSQSLMDQVASLKQKYQDASTVAASYGLDAQALLDMGNELAARTIQRENLSLSQADQSVTARYQAATGDQEGADLTNFDVSAAQQVQQLQDNWEGFLGASYTSSQDYAAQMTDLEKTLGAERLEIQQTYADKATAAQAQYVSQAQSSVTGVFSSLASYVQGLATSDASPLSVQDQYQAANNNFNTDYQAASGGDYNALSRLQADSQTALSLDKQWLGSGVDYAKSSQDMLEKLQAIASQGADSFTANLAKQLSANEVDGMLQVKQSVDDLKAALAAELKQLARVQSVKAS